MSSNPPPPSNHNAYASWGFGTLLLLFYLGVFVFGPNELPEFKHKQLAIVSALLCALFTFFFVGSLHVTLKIENRWAKLGVQSGGGLAAFVLVLWWWNNPTLSPVQIQQDIHKIESTVEKTDIRTESIQQDTQAIVKLLEKELSVKNEQIVFLQNQLQTQKPEISAKAKELAKQIPDTADDYALALKAIAVAEV